MTHTGAPPPAEGVQLAGTAGEVRACFPVMAELRPGMSESEFAERVRRQEAQGYRLAYVLRDGNVVAVAGFRTLENLPWGKFLYVDDLVTAAAERSRGHGQRLLDWLVAEARASGCRELHLDSGVQRFAAHRFYLRNRMDITSHHFALKL